MRIQVNTDSSIQGDERLEEYVTDVIEKQLDRFREDVTRVEVHLSDVNKGKGGADDKRCMMEARIEGLNPTAVTHNASSVQESITGAADKLKRALDTALGKRKNHR
jgi:ribosome-associated translation inhibitor RaiA